MLIENLNSFQDKYKSSWVDLMEVQQNKYQAKQSVPNSKTAIGISNIQSLLQLEIDSDDVISYWDDYSVKGVV